MQDRAAEGEELDMFLTPQEVSDLLRVSIYTIRRWINQGRLPAYKLGRVWRIRGTDFNDWLLRQSTTSTTPGASPT